MRDFFRTAAALEENVAFGCHSKVYLNHSRAMPEFSEIQNSAQYLNTSAAKP